MGGEKNIISKKSQCFCLLGEEPDLEQSRPCHDRDHSKGLRLVMIFRHVLVFVRQLNWFRTRLFATWWFGNQPLKNGGWMVGWTTSRVNLYSSTLLQGCSGLCILLFFC